MSLKATQPYPFDPNQEPQRGVPIPRQSPTPEVLPREQPIHSPVPPEPPHAPIPEQAPHPRVR